MWKMIRNMPISWAEVETNMKMHCDLYQIWNHLVNSNIVQPYRQNSRYVFDRLFILKVYTLFSISTFFLSNVHLYIFSVFVIAWNITRRVGFLDSQIPISWEASVFVAQITAWYFLQRSVDSVFCPTLLKVSTTI